MEPSFDVLALLALAALFAGFVDAGMTEPVAQALVLEDQRADAEAEDLARAEVTQNVARQLAATPAPAAAPETFDLAKLT